MRANLRIIVLAVLAGTLLVVFKGITDRLIPLFAVGAFGAFTASQAGMVVHWRRTQREQKAGRKEATANHVRLWVNAIGAVTTGAALVVIILAKFTEGAWVTILVIPLIVGMFYWVRCQYQKAHRQTETDEPLPCTDDGPPVILVPTDGWNKPTRKSLQLAMQLSPDVTAAHFRALSGEKDEGDEKIREQWTKRVEIPLRAVGRVPPRLNIVATPYREFCDPMLAEVHKLKQEFPQRQIAVMVPEVVKRRWWQFLLQGYRAERLRLTMLQHGDKHLILINVPWYLEEQDEKQSAQSCD